MPSEPHRIAIVGVGKIARDQHRPSIAGNPAFTLAATVSRHGFFDGVPAYTDLDAMLVARPDVTAVALCTPPQVRHALAARAIAAGRHVLLEKPPGATLSEVEDLTHRAATAGVTLFATWHSRFAPAVPRAAAWLAGRTVRRVAVTWKEDVRRWHPGQEWIWQAGGLGVFDPGINALSILTAIAPFPLRLESAVLEVPENRETPIAARLAFASETGADITADFDWRREGTQIWDIRAETDAGVMLLRDGGRRLEVDGAVLLDEPDAEYAGIYARFAALLAGGRSDVDLAPLRLVADAFMIGRRTTVAPFVDTPAP
ncbi:Gfo/Idh/MocA family protein [Azospirillum halopraeferens]|uniref:Gfo/Idh/MocA family protein n=1 Tax=Azospirillum halopraeferens TaxID=34010 RepID=UPI00048E54A1|nr:Gfo/Idh/MocA family oxidoreductase [Azospirillum halopraeferens]